MPFQPTILPSALALGFVAGLRSLTPLAITSSAAERGSLDLSQSPLQFLESTKARNAFVSLAAGELIADKLPFIPNRTDIGPLLARIASGALCGAALATSEKQSPMLASVIGGLGAIAGTFAGFQLRHRAVHDAHVPDLAAAVIEDTLAILVGTLAVDALGKARRGAAPQPAELTS